MQTTTPSIWPCPYLYRFSQTNDVWLEANWLTKQPDIIGKICTPWWIKWDLTGVHVFSNLLIEQPRMIHRTGGHCICPSVNGTFGLKRVNNVKIWYILNTGRLYTVQYSLLDRHNKELFTWRIDRWLRTPIQEFPAAYIIIRMWLKHTWLWYLNVWRMWIKCRVIDWFKSG